MMGNDRKIKVLHIHTRAIVGGSGTNTLLTMAGLRQAGFDVVLVYGPGGPMLEESQKRGIRVAVAPHLRNEINPLNDFLALREIIAFLKEEDFTIVHTHNSKAGILGRWAAKICRVPIIVHTMHGCVFRDPNFNFIFHGFFYLMEKWVAGFTDKIITITETLRQIFIDTKIALPEKLVTIYSGIELEKFRVEEDTEETKRQLGILKGDLVVGIVGRLDKGKGHEFVVKAVPMVAKEVPRVKFVFVGDGPLRGHLEESARRLGVENKIIFTGIRKDIPELLAVFDVFCLASLYEGMGRVILEAQAAGKPVVATRVGGIPEVVSDNNTALLIKPKDAAGLSTALLRLLKDENLRREMSRAAKEFVGYRFSAKKMVEDIVVVYKELLAAQGNY